MDDWIQLLSFGFFLAIFLWTGVLAAKISNRTEADYLLGNRSFGKVFIGLSAGATGNSGWIMIGAVGLAYNIGISALLMLMAIFLGELTFWLFFPGKVNRISQQRNAQTVPELLGSQAREERGKRMVMAVAALVTLVFVGAYTAAQFSAAAKTLNVFFGAHTTVGTLVAAASILVYCITGGLRASIWTDVVQAFVVLFVSIGMLAAVLVAGGGVGEIVVQLRQIDPQLLNLTAGFTWWTLLAYLAGFVFLGFGFDISQPHFLVRLLAGKSPREARQARWIYFIYVYGTWTAMVLFGVICRTLIPSLEDPEQALPTYAMRHFHPLLVGVVLAGVFSVIASTADSQILVCSSALARDLSPGLARKMHARFGLRYQQMMTLGVGVVAAAATLYLTATVFSLVIFAIGALTSTIGPAMLIVLLGRRSSHRALVTTILTGLSVAILWRLLGLHQVLSEALVGFVMALLAHELVFRLENNE